MSRAPEIRGWCPGARRPMPSGDGLLIRAKCIGSRLTGQQLAAIAETAAACGNGLIDLSQRAQLQIRGVREATYEDALRRLDQHGFLAPDADAERVTNVIAAPLTGLDSSARFDANALARDLADSLPGEVELRTLPAKFLFAIDDGGALSLADVAADIRLEASGERIALRVAGAPDQAVIVAIEDATRETVKLARAFLSLRAHQPFELRRMRNLVAAIGLDRVLREAEMSSATEPRKAPISLRNVLGAQQAGPLHFAGVGIPSGRIDAVTLSALASLSERIGLNEARLTPWRALLFPTLSPVAAQEFCMAAQARDLIVAVDDPRLAVVACPGAPECPQALGETRTYISRLAPLAQKLVADNGVALHISGCAKGCAHPQSARATLVAEGDGLFALINDGAASATTRFHALTIDDVERALTMRAEGNSACPTT